MKKQNLMIILCFVLVATGCGKKSNQSANEERVTVIPSTNQEESLTATPEPTQEGISVTPEVDQEDAIKVSYTEEFMDVIEAMKKNYIFLDYKKLDLDSLAKKYEPLFQKADEESDELAAYDAWMSFSNEIPDSHVYTIIKSDNNAEIQAAMDSYRERTFGLDYGFGLITKDNGDTVFVDVDQESEAYELGVRDGSKITTIDGVDVNEAKKNVIVRENISDNTNREFVRSLFLTCDCGETISISFEDESGTVVERTVHGEDSFVTRYTEIRNMYCQNSTEKENLSYEMVSDDTAILYINTMLIVSSNNMNNEGSYEELKNSLKATIAEMKAKGATKLILDIRGNSGGYGDVAKEIASLFTDQELFCYRNSFLGHVNEYGISEQAAYTSAENVWGNGEILILVNNRTASAAEVFAHTMKQLPNVRIIGFTNSAGGTGGVYPSETKNFNFSYPTCVFLDQNDDMMCEADDSGDMKMPVDIRIPMNDEAVQSVFVDREDYVLQYAVDILSQE